MQQACWGPGRVTLAGSGDFMDTVTLPFDVRVIHVTNFFVHVLLLSNPF